MDVSVIFSTYKRTEILNKTLKSFCDLMVDGFTWELIIVDNACDSETSNLVNGYCEKLPITFLTESKPGKNNALNTAIKRATGTLYVFTDDDVLADPKWLQEIWLGVVRWPKHNIFGGRILPAWPEGQKPNFIEDGDDFFRGAYAIADWALPEGCYDPRNIFGANMIVRASLFESGVEFNPKIGPEAGKQYVMGSETEFLLRMEKNGHQAVWLPTVLVLHQIREDQISCKWLMGRAYKSGKSHGLLNVSSHNDSLIGGIPRYLFRQSIEFYFQYLWSWLFKGKRERVQKGIKFWFVYGKIQQLIVRRFFS